MLPGGPQPVRAGDIAMCSHRSDFPAEGLERPITVDFDRQELIRTALLNLVLSVVTLGVWRFWGRVRIRRLIWRSTTLFGDRLEYTGTGGELFRGFLIGMGVLLLLGGPVLAELLAPDHAAVIMIAQGVVAIALPFLILAAIHAARRYLASRTTWRGIRFALHGRSIDFALSQAGRGLLLVLTLGLAYPWFVANDVRWYVGRLSLGDTPFAFDGRGGQLVRPFLGFLALWLLGIILVLGVLAALGAGIAALAAPGNAPAEAAPGMGSFSVWHWLVVIIFFGAITGLNPASAWFWSHLLRWRAEHTILSGTRFSMPGATLWPAFRLLLGNAAIIVLSLGILMPWAMARGFAFEARHLRCDAIPDLSGALQTAQGPRTGEGLAGALDIDALPV